MPEWSRYTDGRAVHTVHGDVHITHDIYSPQLDNSRDILLYLPPSYWHTDRHYPVVYMHDGQNLFDAHTSHSGEWHADETMQRLAGEGIEAILVGIPNMGDDRIVEYNPYPTPRFHDALGDDYVHFISDTLKPLIDSDYRTLPDARHTGILGSSMGGLISLYAWLAYPWTFGLAGVMSPSLWIARSSVLDHAHHAPHNAGRLYLDIGTAEMPRRHAQKSADLHESVALLEAQLRERGYTDAERLRFVTDQGGEHNERSWSRRLPDALRFLLHE